MPIDLISKYNLLLFFLHFYLEVYLNTLIQYCKSTISKNGQFEYFSQHKEKLRI